MYSRVLMFSCHLGKYRFPLVIRGFAGLRGFVVFMVFTLSGITGPYRFAPELALHRALSTLHTGNLCGEG